MEKVTVTRTNGKEALSQLRKYYEEGYSVAQLADMFGCGQTFIKAILDSDLHKVAVRLEQVVIPRD